MDYPYTTLFLNFRKFLSPYTPKLFVGLLLQTIASITWLYWGYAFAEVTNFIVDYQPGVPLDRLYYIFAIWIFIIFLRNFCANNGRKLIFMTSTQVSFDIELFSLKHISQLDIGWHEKENAGNKLKRIQSGGDGVRELTRIAFIRIVDIFINFVGALVVISLVDGIFVWLLIGYQIIYFWIAHTYRGISVRARQERNLKEEEYTGLMFEEINNVRSVKVLNMSNALFNHIQHRGKELLNAVNKLIRTNQNSSLVRGLWEGTVRIAFVIYIVYGILQGQYEVGFLALFYTYFSSISASINDLSEAAQEIALAKTSVARLDVILHTPIGIDNERGKIKFPHNWNTIHLKNLSFSYGDSKALSNIDFEIKRGEKIGVIGLSGAGKSTLFKLLLKEHEATEGDIYFDETPLKKIKKSDYLDYVAAVLQETEVFNMPLRENILLANMKAEKDKDLFEKSINTSHVSDFVHKLPQGLESIIGEKGVKLSGGEKQRVGIARAIFKNPQILLLDEATSHLDVESEAKIKDSLHQFFQGITAIVIAHRLSTIKEMDRIIVVENGTIIESGSFEQLYNQDARFREFWDKQALQA